MSKTGKVQHDAGEAVHGAVSADTAKDVREPWYVGSEDELRAGDPLSADWIYLRWEGGIPVVENERPTDEEILASGAYLGLQGVTIEPDSGA